jgi:hypothetical protein
MDAAALPQLTSGVIDLSLQHLELLRRWEESGRTGSEYPSSLHAMQVQTIRGLRARCVRLLAWH